MIEASLLAAILISFGWTTNAATHITAQVPAYALDSVQRAGGFFQCRDGGWIAFGQDRPMAFAVDHEFQHAYYWHINGHDCPATDIAIRQEFSKHSSDACIGQAIRSNPTDVAHWPHNTLLCTRRNKTTVPLDIQHWYSWLKSTAVRLIIPLVFR